MSKPKSLKSRRTLAETQGQDRWMITIDFSDIVSRKIEPEPRQQGLAAIVDARLRRVLINPESPTQTKHFFQA